MRALVLGLFVTVATAAVAADKNPDIITQGHVNYWIDHQDEASTLPDKNIGNEIYYQVFLDRFQNGNPGNDCVHGGRFCDPDRRDWYRYWGGDMRGLIDAMPYLKDLGVTRVWVTPIFDNSDVTVSRERHNETVEVTSYHGYWIRDWFRLNPYFTDSGDTDFSIVRELVSAGQPEIGILLDTVANHTSPADATAWSLAYAEQIEPLGTGPDGTPRTHRGVLFDDGVYVTSMDEDEMLARVKPGHQRFFHRYGPIIDYDNLYQVENFQLDGLSDLDQTHPVIYDYMRRAHAFWMRKIPGLAGYRMDTIKHIHHDYWKRFDQDFFGEFPDKEIIGEYYGAGPYNQESHPFYKETRQSTFDFDFRYAMFDVFKNDAPMSHLTRLWNQDDRLIDGRALITFLDNHDVPRMRGMGMSYERMRQAIAVWFLARGVPCIYYGMEQDLFFPGDPGDPYNRPMMNGLDPSHDLYRLLQKLTALRKRNPALRYGSTHIVHESRNILAFERVSGGDRAFIITSKNPVAGTDDFEVRNLTLENGQYTDLISGERYQVTEGLLRVSLANGQTIILSNR